MIYILVTKMNFILASYFVCMLVIIVYDLLASLTKRGPKLLVSTSHSYNPFVYLFSGMHSHIRHKQLIYSNIEILLCA